MSSPLRAPSEIKPTSQLYAPLLLLKPVFHPPSGRFYSHLYEIACFEGFYFGRRTTENDMRHGVLHTGGGMGMGEPRMEGIESALVGLVLMTTWQQPSALHGL